MSVCLPCSRERCWDCLHPTCTCDHAAVEEANAAAAVEFGPCPKGDACTAAGCDGTDLGHTLAVDFPAEGARFDAAMGGLVERIRESVGGHADCEGGADDGVDWGAAARRAEEGDPGRP